MSNKYHARRWREKRTLPLQYRIPWVMSVAGRNWQSKPFYIRRRDILRQYEILASYKDEVAKLLSTQTENIFNQGFGGQ